MSKRNRWLIVIGLIVVSVLLDIVVGFGLSNKERQHASVYRMALKTTHKERFNYIVKSQQGKVISYAKMTGSDPVKFHEMTTQRHFMAVRRTLERYTMHTRTYTDSKGNAHTETYWSWDYAGDDEVHSKKLSVFGRQYSANKLNLDRFYKDIDANKLINHGTGLSGSYYYLNGIERYRYEVIPMSIKGSFIADTSKGTLSPIKGNAIKVSKESYKDYLDHNLHEGTTKLIIVEFLLVLAEANVIAYAGVFIDKISYLWETRENAI